MKKILIINIFGIGDVLFTTPLVRNLREHDPAAFIGYVCNRRAQDVLANNPHINKIFVYEKDDYRLLWKQSRPAAVRKALAAFQEIRKERFDVVFDFSLNRMFSFLSRLAGIPRRVGLNYKNRGVFLTDKIFTDGFEGRHVAEHYHCLLSRIGIVSRPGKLEIFPTRDDQTFAGKVLAEHGIGPADLVIGLVPGGGVSWGKDVVFRRWDPQNHAALADKIIEKYKAKVILLGDLSEQELAKAVQGAMRHPVIDLAGKTTIGQYLAVLANCRLVVVNDGGPLHMAVAAGARTVSLIGPVDENVYGPYPKAGHGVVTKPVACRPCYHHFRRADCDHISCLRRITVEEVFGKVEEILK